MVIACISKRDLSSKDLLSQRELISNTHDAEAASHATTLVVSLKKEATERKPRNRAKRWPDFRALDLSNTNDLFTAHQLLVAFGKARDDYEGLRQVVLAAVIARRLAERSPHGYFVAVLREGMGYLVTDRDHDEAKRIMRDLA